MLCLFLFHYSTPKTITYTREHLVFTDTNGQLYHFSVEGNVVKNGSTIPADVCSIFFLQIMFSFYK